MQTQAEEMAKYTAALLPRPEAVLGNAALVMMRMMEMMSPGG